MRSTDTRAILDELFAHPPVSRAELEGRLAPASAIEVRRILLDRVVRGRLREAESDLVVSAFHIVGLGRDAEALIDVVADPRRERHVRACALAVLLAADPTHSERLRTLVPPDDLLSLVAEPLCQFIFHAEADPDEGEPLLSALESVPAEMLPSLFQQLDERRRQGGVPAAVAYERVLRQPSLAALHPAILTALTSEGGQDAVELIEELRSQASDPAARRALQGVLMRMATRSMEGRTRLPGVASAFVSSCDGQSTFFIMGDRQNLDGTHTLALLCVSAQSGIRDGHIATRQQPSGGDSLLERFAAEAGTEFARITMEQAAALVELYRGRGADLPAESLPALRFFGRVEAAALPVIAKARRPSLAMLRSLVQKRPYEQSWFIDRADLASVSAQAPARRQPSVAWFTKTTAALAQRQALIDRLVAMAQHMAIWHQLRGEAAFAGLCLSAAESTRTAPAQSPLLRVLLERSFDEVRTPDAATIAGEPVLGDPLRRQYIKSRFFVQLEEPRGRDLALLDFAEAALLAAERALDSLPGDARPREDELQEAAFAMATLFRDYVLPKPSAAAASTLSDRMAAVLMDVCRQDGESARRIALSVLSALVSFIDEVCGPCATACLHRPRANVSPEFFAPTHPAADGLRAPGDRKLPDTTAPRPSRKTPTAGGSSVPTAPVLPRDR